MTPPAIPTLRELVADWLHSHYSHSYMYVWQARSGARLERELSEKSKNRWRREADALLELIAAATRTTA